MHVTHHARPAAVRSQPPARGVLLLGAAGTCSSATASAAAMLELLAEPEQLPTYLRALRARVAMTDPDYQVVMSVPARPCGRLVLTGARAGQQLAVIIDAQTSSVEHTTVAGLTRRERDVVELVLHGLATKEIAATLSIAPSTVQQHLKAISTRSESAAADSSSPCSPGARTGVEFPPGADA